MKIGMLFPSVLAARRFADRIFAPKPLFVALVDGLVARRHEVYVYCSGDLATRGRLIPGEKLFEEQDLPSIRVRHKEPEFLEKLIYKLTSYEYEVDLTTRAYQHAQGEGVELMHSYHDFLAHYVAPFTHIPTLYTLHDPPFPAETLEGWRLRRFAKDPYIAISHRQAELYGEIGVNIKGIVHHGIDATQIPLAATAGESVVFLGRFIKEKGVEDAITTAEAAGVSLVLATSDNYLETPYYQTELLPRIAPAREAVKVMEFLRGEEKFAVLGSARALLFPVHWEEPFGLVMVEAMAAGTPVVAFARGSVPEVVRDGVTGFIVEPDQGKRGDPFQNPQGKRGDWVIKKTGIEGLIEAVERIYAMGEVEYRSMRRACRAHVEKHFTVEQMVSGYERVYQDILVQKRE